MFDPYRKAAGGPPTATTTRAAVNAPPVAGLLTYWQVAAMARKSVRHAKRAVKANTLPVAAYARCGGLCAVRFFDPEAVARWIAAGCPAPTHAHYRPPRTPDPPECPCGCGRPVPVR